MSSLGTYWSLWILGATIMAFWTFQLHTDTERGFRWRRDFAPAFVALSIFVGLVALFN